MTRIKLKDKLSTTLIASSFFALTTFLFTPLSIYLTNLGNFYFSSNRLILLFYSLFLSAIVIACCSLILLAIKDHLFKNCITVLFAGSFLIWFYCNILVWDYGLFCGLPIKWSDFNYRGIVDIVIYTLVLAALLFKKNLIYRISKKTSIALIIIQLISLIFLASQTKQEDINNNSSIKINWSNQFEFSQNKNIIVLVIDSFQTDFFQEIINKDSSLANKFKGFTYFRNATGGFPATPFSTPLILTGKYPGNYKQKNLFVKDALLSDSSVPMVLKQTGFIVDVYPLNLFYYSDKIISNYLEYNEYKNITFSFSKDILFDYLQLFDVTLFRICPHYFKKNIYANRSWFLKRILTLEKIERFLPEQKTRNNLKNESAASKQKIFSESALNDTNVKFIEDMHAEIAVKYKKPAFKYYHLKGLHPPLYLDEFLTYHTEALPLTRKSYITNAKGILKLIEIFIAQLKENNIFDNSMILIIADHGSRKIPVNITACGYKETASDSQAFKFNIGSGLPLILVKPFDSRYSLKISDAPVSLANISATIFEQLNIAPGAQTEKSMFKIGNNDHCERRFFYHDWQRAEQLSKYIPSMTEYTVSGFSWLRSSWKAKTK